jgi:hypothetical protein
MTAFVPHNSHYSIAVALNDMKRHKSALESHQRALQIRLKLYGECKCDTAESYRAIGVSQRAMKKLHSSIKVASICFKN